LFELKLAEAPCPQLAHPSKEQGDSGSERIYAVPRARLLPDGQDRTHNEVAHELIARVDGE
jgi:hypothetical protein